MSARLNTSTIAEIGPISASIVQGIRQKRYNIMCAAAKQWLLDAKKKLIADIELSFSLATARINEGQELPDWVTDPKEPLILITQRLPAVIGLETSMNNLCVEYMEELCTYSLELEATVALDDSYAPEMPYMVIGIMWPELKRVVDGVSLDEEFVDTFFSTTDSYGIEKC